MAKEPWWKATRTKKQARNAGILWSVGAIAMWAIVLGTGASGWWQLLLAAVWTVSAVSYLATWRLWRPEWD